MKQTRFLTVVSLLVLFVGCSHITAVEPFVDDNVTGPFVLIDGKVTYVSLEGGFWAILGNDNTTYEPMNLPERFQIENLEVSLQAKVRDDTGGFRQVGPIIEIRSIRER